MIYPHSISNAKQRRPGRNYQVFSFLACAVLSFVATGGPISTNSAPETAKHIADARWTRGESRHLKRPAQEPPAAVLADLALPPQAVRNNPGAWRTFYRDLDRCYLAAPASCIAKLSKANALVLLDCIPAIDGVPMQSLIEIAKVLPPSSLRDAVCENALRQLSNNPEEISALLSSLPPRLKPFAGAELGKALVAKYGKDALPMVMFGSAYSEQVFLVAFRESLKALPAQTLQFVAALDEASWKKRFGGRSKYIYLNEALEGVDLVTAKKFVGNLPDSAFRQKLNQKIAARELVAQPQSAVALLSKNPELVPAVMEAAIDTRRNPAISSALINAVPSESFRSECALFVATQFRASDAEIAKEWLRGITAPLTHHAVERHLMNRGVIQNSHD